MKTPGRTALLLALTLGLAAGAHAQPRSITNQLVVHLTFDSTMNDNSGRGNNATYNSANGLATNPAAPTYVAGKLDQAFKFTTKADASLIEFASLGYPEDLQFGTTTDFSVAFWINDNASEVVSDPAYIANRDWNSSGSRGWGIFAQGSGDNRIRVHYRVTEPSSAAASYRMTINANDGAWHHVAVTYQRGGNLIAYFDGVLKNSAAFAAGNTGTLDTYDLLNGLGEPMAVNIGQDGAGAYTQGPALGPPAQPGSASIIAAIDDVGIWRRVLSPTEVVALYNFGQIGTNLFNVPDVTTPVLLSFTPINGAVGVVPSIPTMAVIEDQTTQVDTNSIKLLVDGVPVAYALTKNGATNTVTYTQSFLFAPSTRHTNKLVFADNAVPVPFRSTNVNIYTIASWTNNYLGTRLYYEDFDELPLPVNPPTTYPAGWTVENCTTLDVAGWDLLNVRSEAYMDWQVTTVDIVAKYFGYDGHVRNVSGAIVVNGVASPELGKNNIIFAPSDQRQGAQIDYLYTGDYDLTGKSNIWVAFNSIYSQENGQLAAVEYSIDQAATWLPVVYMVANPILTNGVIDAYATMTTDNTRTPLCGSVGNHYGPFIGVTEDLWGTLGPYISARIAGDHTADHRVEKFPLPMADNQAHVRFRFVLAGGNSWDWGFDSFGIYTLPSSLPQLQITSVGRSSGNITVNWNGTEANFGGLQKATTLKPPNWDNIPGTIGQTSYTEAISGTAFYRAVRF